MALTVPGDLLGVSEEFVAGSGTFEDDGKIFAVAVGAKGTDEQARRLSVSPNKVVRPLARGDLVYGIIQDLYDAIALVEFQPVTDGRTFAASESRMAFVRISELAQGYVERLRDYIRIGDVVRARVLEVKSLGIYLTMKDRDLGVMRAFCSRCRNELSLKGSEFQCGYCGSRERRKLPVENEGRMK